MATFGRRIVCALFVLALGVTSVRAQSVHDAQLWTQVVVTPHLAPDWMVHLEFQPRWSEDMSELNQLIMRTALGLQVTDRMSIWGGYAWIPRTLGPGTEHEQRIWQQLSATFPVVAKWTPSMRLRLEQRFLDSWADSSHRLRMMGRFVRPIDAERRWLLVGWNELMVTLDDTAPGPWQGIDQNRLFGGIARRFNPQVTLEGGYLWQTLEPPDRVRANAHIAFAWLNVAL